MRENKKYKKIIFYGKVFINITDNKFGYGIKAC